MFTTKSTFRKTFFPLFTAFVITITAAVCYAGIILVFTVEGWWVTTWLILRETFSMTFNFIMIAAKVITRWLAGISQVRTAYICHRFTATSRIHELAY